MAQSPYIARIGDTFGVNNALDRIEVLEPKVEALEAVTVLTATSTSQTLAVLTLAVNSFTLAVPGAVVGNPVAVSSVTVQTAGLVITAYVSTAGTVRVQVYNSTGATINANGLFKVAVFQF